MYSHLKDMYGTSTALQVLVLFFLAAASCIFNWTIFGVYCNALMLFGVGHLFLFFVLASRFTNKLHFLLFYAVYVLVDVVFLVISLSKTLDAPWKDCPSEAVALGLFIPSLIFNLLEIVLALSIYKILKSRILEGVVVINSNNGPVIVGSVATPVQPQSPQYAQLYNSYQQYPPHQYVVPGQQQQQPQQPPKRSGEYW